MTNTTLSSRPGSALIHDREVANCPEVADSVEVANCPQVADSVDARTCSQKTADMDGFYYSPDDPHYCLGPVHTCIHV